MKRTLALALAAGIALTGAAPAAAHAESARSALQDLRIAGHDYSPRYDRDLFGTPWADTDRNGCDTRNDILKRDLRYETFRPGGCLVDKGLLRDPYTNRLVRFKRGTETSRLVPIDHRVALSDAWKTGAQQWSAAKRLRFANDPLNLQATTLSANSAKGDANAAGWLPPHRAYRCAYVAHQIAVKRAYGLYVTRSEKRMMGYVLATCPTQPLPTG